MIMQSIPLDLSWVEGVIEKVVDAANRRAEESRPRDEAGRVLLTKREAAKAMGVSEKTLDKWRDQYGLPHIKLDTGKPMYRLEGLQEWAKQHEQSLATGG